MLGFSPLATAPVSALADTGLPPATGAATFEVTAAPVPAGLIYRITAAQTAGLIEVKGTVGPGRLFLFSGDALFGVEGTGSIAAAFSASGSGLIEAEGSARLFEPQSGTGTFEAEVAAQVAARYYFLGTGIFEAQAATSPVYRIPAMGTASVDGDIEAQFFRVLQMNGTAVLYATGSISEIHQPLLTGAATFIASAAGSIITVDQSAIKPYGRVFARWRGRAVRARWLSSSTGL